MGPIPVPRGCQKTPGSRSRQPDDRTSGEKHGMSYAQGIGVGSWCSGIIVDGEQVLNIYMCQVEECLSFPIWHPERTTGRQPSGE